MEDIGKIDSEYLRKQVVYKLDKQEIYWASIDIISSTRKKINLLNWI